MLRHLALLRSVVSEERIASIIRVTNVGVLEATLAVTTSWSLLQTHSVLQLLVTANVPSSLVLLTLMMEALRSPQKSVLTKETRCHILEDGKPMKFMNQRSPLDADSTAACLIHFHLAWTNRSHHLVHIGPSYISIWHYRPLYCQVVLLASLFRPTGLFVSHILANTLRALAEEVWV
jgi:hypothetical protein